MNWVINVNIMCVQISIRPLKTSSGLVGEAQSDTREREIERESRNKQGLERG